MKRTPLAWVVSVLAALLVFAVAVPAGATAHALDVTTAALAVGEADVTYSQTLQASGGTTPYSWSLATGTLPAGLTLNASSGLISGTPTTAGQVAFTVQVLDSDGTATTQALSITVASGLAVSTSSLPAASSGVAYTKTLTVSGGVAPYTWLVASGALPAGLTLNTSTGTISGTPTTAATTDFTIRVRDELAAEATRGFAITVTAESSTALTITTLELPKATVGTAYSQSLTATGGTAPLTWSLVAGNLPAGLSLNAGTGVIAGTPTAAGIGIFAVRVTDAGGAVTARILFVNVKKSETTEKPRDKTSDLDARVLAACDVSIDSHPAMDTLCSLYMGGKLGGVAQPMIGRVILKLADRAELEQDKADRKDREREIRAEAKADEKARKSDALEIRARAKADAKADKDLSKSIKKLNGHVDLQSAAANATISLHDDEHESVDDEHSDDRDHESVDDDQGSDEHEHEGDDD